MLPNTRDSDLDFTFGIITAGSDYIQRIVDSIRSQNIPNYEIIIVGKTSISGNNIITIPFDESIKKGWITKKKNIISQNAKYENIVFLHDYYELTEGWYEGFKKFGNGFQICINKITNLHGARFRDYVLFKGILPIETTLLPYSHRLSPKLSKLAYISGGYYVVKRNIALKFPLLETLSWNQGEDVIFSHTLSRNNIIFECNQYSSVHLLKEKGTCGFEKEMSEETFAMLCEWAETHGDQCFEDQCNFQNNWVSQFIK